MCKCEMGMDHSFRRWLYTTSASVGMIFLCSMIWSMFVDNPILNLRNLIDLDSSSLKTVMSLACLTICTQSRTISLSCHLWTIRKNS